MFIGRTRATTQPIATRTRTLAHAVQALRSRASGYREATPKSIVASQLEVKKQMHVGTRNKTVQVSQKIRDTSSSHVEGEREREYEIRLKPQALTPNTGMDSESESTGYATKFTSTSRAGQLLGAVVQLEGPGDTGSESPTRRSHTFRSIMIARRVHVWR